MKAADKLRVKAEKEKVARSLELLNFLLKTVTQQVRVGLILRALCSVTVGPVGLFLLNTTGVSVRCHAWIL